MKITIMYSLFNLIKMEDYVQKIIKGTAKLSVAHWWKVLAYAKSIYFVVSLQNIVSNRVSRFTLIWLLGPVL
jgi:hypothetical protein